MLVDHAIDAVIVFLQSDPAPDSPQIIAEMQVAGWLDTGKDELFKRAH